MIVTTRVLQEELRLTLRLEYTLKSNHSYLLTLRDLTSHLYCLFVSVQNLGSLPLRLLLHVTT
jgi:hypothetical protein